MSNAAPEHERDEGDLGEGHSSRKRSRPIGPAFAAPEADAEDLSGELVSRLPRGSGELLRCRRISGDRYRCNWWGSPQGDAARENSSTAAPGLNVTTHRVIRSQMLRVTRTSDGLAIDADPQQ